MIGVLFGYVMFGLVAAVLLPVFFDDEPELVEGLGGEGKVVLALGAGLLWPLLIVVGIGWLLRAAGRGIAQVARLVRSPRVSLPKATAKEKP